MISATGNSCRCTRHGFGVTCRGCRLAGTRFTKPADGNPDECHVTTTTRALAISRRTKAVHSLPIRRIAVWVISPRSAVVVSRRSRISAARSLNTQPVPAASNKAARSVWLATERQRTRQASRPQLRRPVGYGVTGSSHYASRPRPITLQSV